MKKNRRTVDAPFGEIEIFRLENGSGAWVELSSLGAGVLSVGVADTAGRIDNVALGYASPADYMSDGPGMGKCPGRYANRIAFGRFRIGDRNYRLDTNLAPHHLHGGATGFHNRLWKARPLEDGVEFTYRSSDGEEGYPGNLDVAATYRWSEDSCLSLELSARCDADTVVNLTNHCYWNLDGCDAGSVLGHEMRLRASRWLETDSTLVPTGRLAEVVGTPMDFLDFKEIGRDIHADFEALRIGKGYDHCWAVDGWRPGRMSDEAVVVRSRKTGRQLTVDSDQPGFQVYTGNWLSGSPRNRSGRSYEDYEGVAVEMQGFPDAPNHPEFPAQLLRAGEEYRRTIMYRFGLCGE